MNTTSKLPIPCFRGDWWIQDALNFQHFMAIYIAFHHSLHGYCVPNDKPQVTLWQHNATA